MKGWKEIVPEGMQEELFDMIEKELNRKSQEDGLLKLTIPFVLIDSIKQ